MRLGLGIALWLLLRPLLRVVRARARLRSLIELYGMANPADDAFYDVTLTGCQLDWLRQKLKAAGYKSHEKGIRTSVTEALSMPQRTDLPPGKVDWDAIEREAEERGSSVVDLLYDKAHMRDDPGGA